MAPKIKLFRIIDARMPHSLSIEEEQFLFHQLPSHLLRMALYKANTGSRQEEVCGLEWERKMPERDTSVFVIPGEKVKNTEERLVVLSRIARSVIEEARGMHPVYVFVRQSKHGLAVPVKKMNNTGWRSARERAADAWERAHGTVAPKGFRRVGVHDPSTRLVVAYERRACRLRIGKIS